MKILVTSGGTKIPIDKVRNITNMSTGAFGSKIASELLMLDQEVVFYHSVHSETPFTFNTDLYKITDCNDFEITRKKLIEKIEFLNKYITNYYQYKYDTFDSYHASLRDLMALERPSVVVLAAAVSDYGVESPVDGKIRTKENLTIQLKPLPKVISLIKQWHPSVKLVGFKMLVDSKEEELIDAAKESIEKNGCDMVVANDLSEIRNNSHRIHIVFKDRLHSYNADPVDKNFLARIVASHINSL